MNYETYVSLLRSVDDLIRMFDDHPDERTRERVIGLLGGIDAVHREGLERLVGRLREFGGDMLLERLADDPVVDTLLGLYGIRELDVPDEEGGPGGEVVGFVPLDQLGVGRKGASPPEGGP